MTGHFVHPFDDDDFISGNGTAGLEIVEDLPDVDAVVAPIGGGGLLAGIGVALRALRPAARDLRRRAGNRRAARASLAAGKASRFDEWQPSFVDGAGGKSVLATMWPLLQRVRERSIVVSLDEAARGDARWSRNALHVIAEGAAACAVAAALSPAMAARGHRKVVAVVSGGNIDLATFAQLVGACPPDRRCPVRNRPFDHDHTASTSDLPERISRLPELANDLWWTWNPQAREVFRQLDYPLWRQTAHNPVLMLQQRRRRSMLEPRRADDRFLAVYDAAIEALDARARRARHLVAAPLSRTQPGRSPTSPPSSRCTSRCRSTPAASACSPAITARKRATSACR